MKTFLHLVHAVCFLVTLPMDAPIFHATGRYAETTKVVEKVKVKTRTRYIVSESWCPNCPAAKARFIRNGWPAENVITIAQCRQRFGFTVPHVPYEFEEPDTQPAARPETRKSSPPNRYIQWPGWGTIDLETYNRNCNCGMCRSIRAKQAEYRRQMQAYQSSIRDDQQPCPIALIEQMLDLMQL